MQEIKGTVWEHHNKGRWIVVTTTNKLKSGGINRQVVDHIPKFPKTLKAAIKKEGNKFFVFDDFKVITLPVKYHWRSSVSLSLIEHSLQQLAYWADYPTKKHGKFYLPKIGCEELEWSDVAPLVRQYLDDRFVVVGMVTMPALAQEEEKDYRLEGLFPSWTSPSGKCVIAEVPFYYDFATEAGMRKFLSENKFADVRIYYKGVLTTTPSINYKYKVQGIFAAHTFGNGEHRQEMEFINRYVDREKVLDFLNACKPFAKLSIYDDVTGANVTYKF